MTRPSVALVVIALDEEKMLGDCLESAAPVADQTIVAIDSRTTDQTYDVATHHGATVVDFTYAEDLAAARNTAQAGAWTDWVLSLDADERLTDWGRLCVQWFTKDPKQPGTTRLADGLAMELENQTLDGQVSSRNPSNIRLYRNAPSIRWHGLIHSEVRIDGDPTAGTWLVASGQVGIVHLGYDPALVRDRDKDARNLYLLGRQLNLDPNDGQAWAYLAEQHALMGRDGQARTAASHAIRSGWYDSRPDLLAKLRAIRDGRAA